MVLDAGSLVQSAADVAINIGIFVAVILIGIFAGYVIGALLAAIVRRIMRIKEIKEQIAGSEILSLSFWNKLTDAVSIYVKWLFVAVGLRAMLGWAATGEFGNESLFGLLLQYAQTFQDLMVNLGVFIIFSVVGIVVGAIVYKIIKATLDSMRVEEKLAKHGLQDALGGIGLTKVLAGIFMIYIIIVLMGSGIDAVAVRAGPEFSNISLVQMFKSLIELYPEFVLGGLIIIAGALIGDFLQEKIRKNKASIATESTGFIIKGMVIFFAIVLALPHFQIQENVDVLTDSFKIIVAGVAIGLAIAMGLGLSETFSHWGKKLEKKV